MSGTQRCSRRDRRRVGLPASRPCRLIVWEDLWASELATAVRRRRWRGRLGRSHSPRHRRRGARRARRLIQPPFKRSKEKHSMRRRGIGRVGRPGLVGTAATTAVVVGTASAVSGKVSAKPAGQGGAGCCPCAPARSGVGSGVYASTRTAWYGSRSIDRAADPALRAEGPGHPHRGGVRGEDGTDAGYLTRSHADFPIAQLVRGPADPLPLDRLVPDAVRQHHRSP